MAILKKWTKQPAEVQDYDISFTAWLAALSDTAASFTAAAETGISLDSSSMTAGVVKVWLSGGTNGTKYKVTATITTTAGRVKEDEILIDVVES